MLDVLNLFFGSPRDLPGHLGFLLIAVSLFLTSIFCLRVLLVLSFASLIVYYSLAPIPLYAGIAWSLLFIAINLYRLLALLRARRVVDRSGQAALLRASLGTLDDEELARIAQGGEAVSFDAGATLISEGEPIPALYLIMHGRADVIVKGRHAGRLGRGAFVGDIALLTASPSAATIRAATPLEAIALDPAALDAEGAENPHLAAGVYRALGISLAGKLASISESRPG